MIIFHGSIRKFSNFNKDTVVQNLNNDIDTVGFWFTSDMNSAKQYAIGSETVFQKSETEFWEDGEPKVLQMERTTNGFIYRVYIDDPHLKEYVSTTEDSYELFMRERDQYCDYLGTKSRKPTWKDKAILLNKEEANAALRKNLIKQGYEGFVIRDSKQSSVVTDLYCVFSEDALLIVDVLSVDDL